MIMIMIISMHRFQINLRSLRIVKATPVISSSIQIKMLERQKGVPCHYNHLLNFHLTGYYVGLGVVTAKFKRQLNCAAKGR